VRMAKRSRTNGQAIVFAAIGMVALVGASAMVIDLGIFFVIQRSMQNAADSAALAAAWYYPVCDPIAQGSGGCQPSGSWTSVHPIPPGDSCFSRPYSPSDREPCAVAKEYANRNLALVAGLCSGPASNAALPAVASYPGGPPYILANGGAVNIYVVTIECYAPYWFGHIFPNLPLSHHIATNAAATIGWRGPNGDLAGSALPPNNVLIARLFRTT
jgi:hypothetical protein